MTWDSSRTVVVIKLLRTSALMNSAHCWQKGLYLLELEGKLQPACMEEPFQLSTYAIWFSIAVKPKYVQLSLMILELENFKLNS